MDLVVKDREIRRRFCEAAAALGLSETQALERAGIAHDTFNHVPSSSGRRRRTLEKMAEAVQRPVEWLDVGDPVPPSPQRDERLARLALVADVACHLYVALAERGALGAVAGSELARSVIDLIDQESGTPGKRE